MAQLPYTQAVQRFRENDERFDQFLNDTLGTGVWVTAGGQSKETLPHLLTRVTDEINGAISGVFAARDQAVASASAAQAYATTVASQAGTVASQASTVNTQYNAVNSAALVVEANRAQVAANTANVAANTVQVANDRAFVDDTLAQMEALATVGIAQADTKANGDTLAASLPNGAHVRVREDETATPSGITVTYTVASGALTSPVPDTAMNILYACAQDGASLAELPIPNLPPERTVIVPVAGFYSAGDGGGGQFYWQYNSNETPVPGMIINPAGNVGAGRWKRVVYSGAGDVVDLTYSASLDWDMNDGYMFRVTLTGDTELQLPANLKPGTHIMYVYQDAIGGHIMTFQTGYRAPRGLLPVLSTIPDGVDILTFVSDGVKVDVNIQANMLEG